MKSNFSAYSIQLGLLTAAALTAATMTACQPSKDQNKFYNPVTDEKPTVINGYKSGFTCSGAMKDKAAGTFLVTVHTPDQPGKAEVVSVERITRRVEGTFGDTFREMIYLGPFTSKMLVDATSLGTAELLSTDGVNVLVDRSLQRVRLEIKPTEIYLLDCMRKTATKVDDAKK